MAVDDDSGADQLDPDESAWSVSRLNDEIANTLEDAASRFPTYVVGEVSEVTAKPYGTFFKLNDVDGSETIQCIAWSSFRDQFADSITADEEVIVRADVDFYTDGGRTQLNVKDYWAVGDSERAQELEALRAALEAEGLFDADRKQALPEYPSNIGVVTSLTGSAREDFQEAAHTRARGVTITIFGATVQGANAAPSLVSAVRRANADPDIDLIVVTRGGGADDTLWCFNEEPVVRAIADCNTPTIVAVGHEDDSTLAEDVADRVAITPTDAGIAATPDMAGVRERVQTVEQRVGRAYQTVVADQLTTLERRLETAMTGLEQASETRRAKIQRAADLEQRIETAYTTLTATRLTEVDDQIDSGLQEIAHAAETEALTTQAARDRVAGLEARVDQAYTTNVRQETTALEQRIESAYQDIESEADVQKAKQEAQRLRIVILLLVVLLVIAAAAWALGIV
ncbi:Exodeoxyribonuclease VII large subunit [Halorubrum sp. DM2]|uniref:exodeoxyribonuclease VII large subunit n=1 Tax=Halorubrum sp. DM2 TaxID=2527867 RepID=UPI0024B75CBD|nr:exodeoxyribonuclease VII large subunit [Halorubrum sp. DM2]VTT86287.1 Exodeoxyribonuclease VII large subunit [Halorubrum sp. DM2]